MEHIRTRRTQEKKDGIALITAQFWKGSVMLGGTKLPLGQVSTDVLNLDLQKLQDLRLKNDKLFRAIVDMLDPTKNLRIGQVTEIQALYNDTVNIILELPLYRHLKLDKEELNHLLTEPYFKNPMNFERTVKTPNHVSETIMKMIKAVCMVPDEMVTFSIYTQFMLTDYFEGLDHRLPESYAVSVYRFFTNEWVQKDVVKTLESLSTDIYLKSRQVSFEYVTMPDPDDIKKYVVAERLEFHTAAAFLHTDFYRGLIQGNAPRKCHNCGQYFLLTTGHDTCYCNNIAPGETDKTCRKIGAHRKQASTSGKTPAQLEYNKVYNRLTTRKSRGKISINDRNNAVAEAQKLKDKAERGKITDAESKEIFKKF